MVCSCVYELVVFGFKNVENISQGRRMVQLTSKNWSKFGCEERRGEQRLQNVMASVPRRQGRSTTSMLIGAMTDQKNVRILENAIIDNTNRFSCSKNVTK